MDETTPNRQEIERRYWVHFEILKSVWTQSSGGDLTVLAAVGNHGMGAMKEKGLKAGLS